MLFLKYSSTLQGRAFFHTLEKSELMFMNINSAVSLDKEVPIKFVNHPDANC